MYYRISHLTKVADTVPNKRPALAKHLVTIYGTFSHMYDAGQLPGFSDDYVMCNMSLIGQSVMVKIWKCCVGWYIMYLIWRNMFFKLTKYVYLRFRKIVCQVSKVIQGNFRWLQQLKFWYWFLANRLTLERKMELF